MCADSGSDSYPYQNNPDYEVILVGEKIGVENFVAPPKVYGVIANPVCKEFSTAKGFHKENDIEKGMFLVNHCQRIIRDSDPVFWMIENPFNGKLKDVLGYPDHIYQPWEFGSPWTKKTAIWGKFNKPEKLFSKWEDVVKNDKLYQRPGRGKPSLAFMHKSAINFIPEFEPFRSSVKNDADFRSLCSQGFANEFFKVNR